MFTQLIRCLNRQTFKLIQTQNYVKRFYSNQELNQKFVNEDIRDKEYDQQFANDWEETSKVYQEYYRRYYDNFKNKFDNNNTDRQTDDNNGNKNKHQKNNEKFKSNSYSFSECKYHLLTLRLLEKVGYLGAAIVVGLHFESPIYYSRQRALRNSCDRLDSNNDSDNCSQNVCGKCKYCSAILSRLRVLSAPIRRNYMFAKSKRNYLEYNDNNITEIPEEKNFEQPSVESEGIEFTVKNSIKPPTDPIDDICHQLETASIDYVDRLNNMLGISLIQTDPEEAMQCWRSTRTSSKAIFNMGVAFEKGVHSTDGVVDLKQAFDHYLLSASMGHKLAIYNLSLFYLYGKGEVAVDLNKAESLLRRAAKLGVKPAEKYIEQLEKRRTAQLFEKNQTMRSSASAPNLMHFNTRFDSFKNENQTNYSLNYSIANRV